MLIPISALLVFGTALTLLVLRVRRPEFRFTWLVAAGGTFLAWMSVLLWQTQIPVSLALPAWEPAYLFSEPFLFSADGLSWPYALSLITVAAAILLTASVRADFPNPFAWAGSLTLCGLGLLAVTAGNPLTLALVWAALDLGELITMLRSVQGREHSERAVIALSIHAFGIVLLLAADVVTVQAGKPTDFLSAPPQAGLLLLAAAGLRLGVLPLHLPYGSEASLRRGLGTTLRLVSAASSLVLLARIPVASLASPLAPLLLILAAMAALYGGWMWLRAPDELIGRPFWIIGLAGLAVACALRGNPAGATAWGVDLILVGGALFLASVQQVWMNRALLIGAWALSSLPFSLSALAWQSSAIGLDFTLPLFLGAQALILAGFIRHALRPSARPSLETQPPWAKSVYPAGIGLLLFIQFMLGLWGWEGASQVGTPAVGIAASLLTLVLLWAIPRFPVLNPARAHWVQSAPSRLDRVYQNLWALYRWLGRIGQTVTDILEGEAGIMWTLLFLVLFVSLIVHRNP